MSALSPLMIAVHAVAAIIWVGGMFFAYSILRPTLGGVDGPQRLQIWAGVFGKFFPWVWASAILLLLTGYWQIFWDFGGIQGTGIHIKLMMGIGILMVFIFFYLFFGPYEKFKACIAEQDWTQAAERLNQIRQLVLTT